MPAKKNCFNTSYVVIKQCSRLTKRIEKTSFNTSYVVIKLMLEDLMVALVKCFNTSYVVIKLGTVNFTNSSGYTFQYILCCY